MNESELDLTWILPRESRGQIRIPSDEYVTFWKSFHWFSDQMDFLFFLVIFKNKFPLIFRPNGILIIMFYYFLKYVSIENQCKSYLKIK